jgi:hypothetical protein
MPVLPNSKLLMAVEFTNIRLAFVVPAVTVTATPRFIVPEVFRSERRVAVDDEPFQMYTPFSAGFDWFLARNASPLLIVTPSIVLPGPVSTMLAVDATRTGATNVTPKAL